MTKEATKTFTVNFPMPVFEEIVAEAKKQERPVGQLIKIMAREYLKKNSEKSNN